MSIRVLHVGVEPEPVATDLRRRPDLTVESVASVADVLTTLPADFDCVLLEDGVSDGGLASLGRIRQVHPDIPLVLLVADPEGGYVVEPLGPGSTRSVRLTTERGVATLASVIAARVGSGSSSADSGDSSVPGRAIMDTVGDGVYTVDAEGRFTSVNDTMVTMTGYSREELLGEHVSAILDDRDIADSEREIRGLLRGDGEAVRSLDITIRTADDEAIPCENRFSLLPDDGEFRGTVGVVRDITERKRMEAKLRESRDKIARLHEVTTELIRCGTEPEIYERAVAAAESILAFDVCGIDVVEGEYLVPKYVSTGMPGDGSDRMSVEEGIAGKTYRTGETYLVDDVQDHADARPVQVEFRSILSVPVGDDGVFQAAAREVGAFDDTDAELAELLLSHVSEALARVRSEKALRESETKYRTLIEQSRDAVFIYRGEEFAFVNERTCELTGYDRSDFEELTVLDLIHPDERDQVAETMERRAGGEEVPAYETKVVTSDGSVRHFEINARSIAYEGEPAVLCSARDVTDRKRRKREIERQNERLREFTSVVSHDLRNPLNVASGYLGLAEETGEEEYFDRIRRSLDRMEQLIDDLLAQARHGQTVIDPQLLELPAVATAAWENVDTGAADLVVEDGLGTVEADENQLLTALENLYRNAVEHGSTSPPSQAHEDAVEHGSTSPRSRPERAHEDAAEHGGPTVTVRIGPTDDGFFVEDDGPGIDPENREEIFERGYTAADDGTGLGLAIVESTADAHGWSVELAEASEGGARFEFEV